MASPLDLLAALRVLPLRRTGSDRFELIGPVPAAFAACFPALAAQRPITAATLTADFPFLTGFLDDAALLWNGRSTGSLASGPWQQDDATGRPAVLEAKALHAGPDRTPFLLLELLGSEFAELQEILQKARDQRLEYEHLSRLHQALSASSRQLQRLAEERQAANALLRAAREELEQRVAERTVALTEANARLQQESAERARANAALLAHQEQLRTLAEQLVGAEEAERRQIAEFLHDRIGQNLALVKMRLRTLAEKLPEARGPLDETSKLMDEVISDTRGLTADLGTPALYELGLEAALDSLVRRFGEVHGIPARFDDDGNEKPLAERARLLAYQSVRELLHNIVKHAEASLVVVRTARDGASLLLSVTDRGLGFDASRFEYRVTAAGGFGLFNIRERVTHLGGTCRVVSTPGRGTEVTLTLPLDAGTRGQKQ
ncbi:MAG: sensor histidine kinase [Planctomycetes bacterium]|nr:sensor histidine kinase [Planctomycetota bacterium]